MARKNPHTRYVEIAEHYRQKIRSGELAPGDPMPSMNEVIAQFGVAMTTVNRAYRKLQSEGLTVARPGVGTFVSVPSSPSITDRVRNYATTGRALDVNEDSQIIGTGKTPAAESVALRMGVEPGTLLQYRLRLVTRDGEPSHMTTSYYPSYVIQAVPELTEPVSTGGSRELASERLGSPQDVALNEAIWRPATEEEAQRLQLDAGATVLQTTRTVHLKDGRIVEVAVKVCNSETILRWTEKL